MYSAKTADERHELERRSLIMRIDALTTAIAREKGIQLDMSLRPRQLEASEGWLDQRPVVVVNKKE